MEEHLEQVPTVRLKRSSNISSIIGQLRGWTICPTALGRGEKIVQCTHCAMLITPKGGCHHRGQSGRHSPGLQLI